jgi:hypothetical protein
MRRLSKMSRVVCWSPCHVRRNVGQLSTLFVPEFQIRTKCISYATMLPNEIQGITVIPAMMTIAHIFKKSERSLSCSQGVAKPQPRTLRTCSRRFNSVISYSHMPLLRSSDQHPVHISHPSMQYKCPTHRGLLDLIILFPFCESCKCEGCCYYLVFSKHLPFSPS